MTRILALAAATLIGAATVAEARPNTTRMTCHQAQDFVLRHGAVVMDTGPRTFERIVASRRFCERTQYLRTFWAPTRDAGQCRVGYRCVERSSRKSFGNGR